MDQQASTSSHPPDLGPPTADDRGSKEAENVVYNADTGEEMANADVAARSESVASAQPTSSEVAMLLEVWGLQAEGDDYDPVPTLTRMSDLVEEAMVEFLKLNCDPFDDRHPTKVAPDAELGLVLKNIFRNEDFVSKLVISYLLRRDNVELCTVAARLLLGCAPGLDAQVVFQETDDLIPTLYEWARQSEEPLQSYATGLLAVAMESSEISAQYRDENNAVIPQLIERLKLCQTEMAAEASRKAKSSAFNRSPVYHFQDETFNDRTSRPTLEQVLRQRQDTTAPHCDSGTHRQRRGSDVGVAVTPIRPTVRRHPTPMPAVTPSTDVSTPPAAKRPRLDLGVGDAVAVDGALEDGNSCSWMQQERLVIGTHQLFPLTVVTQQRLILQFLAPVSEYQDLLVHAFSCNVLETVFEYIDLTKNTDVRLAYDALRYLASLLVHRKFAIEFVQRGGVEKILCVYRQSMASTGVALCLYYLSYNKDIMEKLCQQLSPDTLEKLVDYSLYLVEHSYESGKCHATMFFIYAFAFRGVVELFDTKDGLRKLYNSISTMSLLQMDEDDTADMDDDQLYQSRQSVRNVCLALRSYLVSQLYMKLQTVRLKPAIATHNNCRIATTTTSSALAADGGLPIPPIMQQTAPWKAIHMDANCLKEAVWLTLHVLPTHAHWRPVEQMRHLNAIKLLLFVIADAPEWNFSAKAEVVRSALEVLWICSVIPKVQLDLCETLRLRDNIVTEGISVILGSCDGELLQDGAVQRAALSVLVNCVCGPHIRPIFTETLLMKTALQCPPGQDVRQLKRKPEVDPLDLLEKMWERVRQNNGIMILRNLLSLKTPITEADSIRSLACRALCGMARCDIMKQIISKMPLISSNELHWLMREPVCQDKRLEHQKFCEHGRALIESVTGRPMTADWPSDMTQEKLQKAWVVSQTKITWNETELLQLLHHHLIKKGLKKTAAILEREADLPTCAAGLVAATPRSIGPFPRILDSGGQIGDFSVSSEGGFQRWMGRSSFQLGGGTQSMIGGITAYLTRSADYRNANRRPIAAVEHQNFDGAFTPGIATSARAERRLILHRTPLSRNNKPRLLNALASSAAAKEKPFRPYDTLDGIIADYFRNKHLACKNPASSCPPFSFSYSHQCPEPKLRQSAPVHLTARFFKRPIFPVGGGYDGVRCDQRFIFSRFKPIRYYHDEDNEETFTCCSFSIDDEHILLGSYTGDLRWYNVASGSEESRHTCHNSAITGIEQTQDGSMLLTSSAFVKPYCSLWKVGEALEHKLNFPDETFVEFSKFPQDRVVGTRGHQATVFDCYTGNAVVELYNEEMANRYTKNCATFHPLGNDLILSDGLLWDTRGKTIVHKFDKLNPHISGLFHPRGLEAIINTEVWDIRTFRLLHTVPALDQCKIVFNSSGDIIYGTVHNANDDEDIDEQPGVRSPFGSSFRTFDAKDYQPIATHDIRKSIFDLAADHRDAYVAVIENSGHADDLLSLEVNFCRLYEVGKNRQEEDEGGADEETPEEENNEDEEEDEGSDDDDEDDDDADDDDDDGADDDDLDAVSSFSEQEEDVAALVEDAFNDGDQSRDSPAEPLVNVDQVDAAEQAPSDSNSSDGDSDVMGEDESDAGLSSSSDDDDEDVTYVLGGDSDDAADVASNDGDQESAAGSSSIILNPQLRRMRRRQQDGQPDNDAPPGGET